MTVSLMPMWYLVNACLAIAMLCSLWRLLRGPTAQDRVTALDTLYLGAMLLVLLQGMQAGTRVYFDIALLMALLGFVGSVAMAKFLLRGEVIE